MSFDYLWQLFSRVAASAQAQGQVEHGKRLENLWQVECRDRDGNLKWAESFENLVTTEGLNDSLDKHLKGSNYSAAWYVGLTSASPTFNANHTLASHTGWTEVTAYSGNRKALTLGTVAAGSVDNSSSPAAFSINANGTAIGGAFVCSAASGTSGVLYAGGAFTGGDKTLSNGDTLNVTCTLTASAT